MLIEAEDPWYWATWQGATDATLLAGARLTMAQKLDWLEEMNRIAARLSTELRSEGRPIDHPESVVRP